MIIKTHINLSFFVLLIGMLAPHYHFLDSGATTKTLEKAKPLLAIFGKDVVKSSIN